MSTPAFRPLSLKMRTARMKSPIHSPILTEWRSAKRTWRTSHKNVLSAVISIAFRNHIGGWRLEKGQFSHQEKGLQATIWVDGRKLSTDAIAPFIGQAKEMVRRDREQEKVRLAKLDE